MLIASLLVGGCATHAPPVARLVETPRTPVVVETGGVLDVGPGTLTSYQPMPPEATREVTVAAAPAPAKDLYVVRPGDTLFAIARRELGNAARWRDLAAANPQLSAGGTIRVGERLTLPR